VILEKWSGHCLYRNPTYTIPTATATIETQYFSFILIKIHPFGLSF